MLGVLIFSSVTHRPEIQILEILSSNLPALGHEIAIHCLLGARHHSRGWAYGGEQEKKPFQEYKPMERDSCQMGMEIP